MSVYDHSADLSYNPSPLAPREAPPSDQAPDPQAMGGTVDTSGRRDVSLIFIGASMTAGYGDPKGLGWVGRVVVGTQHPDLDLTSYNLGVRGQTSAEVMSRWRGECAPRWRGERRLVVSVGAADVTEELSLARSRLNLANILDEAASTGIAALVVGLTPRVEPGLNARIEALADAQADVCGRRSVPYVDCFRPLLGHDQWAADLSAGDGVHPGQIGYGLMSWIVLHNGWDAWMRLSR